MGSSPAGIKWLTITGHCFYTITIIQWLIGIHTCYLYLNFVCAFRFITYLPQIKILLHFGNVVEMEKDFSVVSAVTPFTISVTIVVAGTLFLIVYDMIRWWKENKRKKMNTLPTKLIPYKKFVHTLREHKEVYSYKSSIQYLYCIYLF